MSVPEPRWQRLGELLIQRRIELAPRYRERTVFAAEKGLDWRLLHDIEQAKRDTFKPQTLAAIEVAYRWQPGSIARVLTGGSPVPIADRPAAGIPGDDPVVEYVRSLPGLSPGERESLEEVARPRPHLDVATRRALVGLALAMRDQDQAQNQSA